LIKSVANASAGAFTRGKPIWSGDPERTDQVYQKLNERMNAFVAEAVVVELPRRFSKDLASNLR